MSASSRTEQSPAQALRLDLALLGGLLALYLGTLNRQYQLDALDYATAARDGVGLFHPHHLLYNVFAWLVVHAVGQFEMLGRVEPLVTLAVVNALVTCAAVFLCGRLVLLQTGDRRLARGVALAYGVCHGIWYMATSVEVYPLAMLCELVALNLVARPPPDVKRLIGAGLASALAMCFHQTALFAVPAVILILERRVHRLVYGGLALGLTAAIYLAVGWHEGIRTAPEFLRWLFMYAHTPQFAAGVWGGGLHPSRLIGGVAGLCGAFVLPAFVWDLRAFSPYRPGLRELLPLVLLGAGIVLLFSLWRRGRPGRIAAPTAQRRAWTRGLAVWAVCHALFTLWWESVNFEFWLMLLPPLALFAAWRFAALDTGSPRLRRRALLGLSLCVAGGYFATFLPNHSRHPSGWLQALQVLKEHGLARDDLVLTNEPAIYSYAPYFLGLPIRVRTLGGSGATAEGLARDAADFDAAQAADRLFLLETELRDDHPGLSAEQTAQFYAPRLRTAETIGAYPAYGTTWKIYRLRPRSYNSIAMPSPRARAPM